MVFTIKYRGDWFCWENLNWKPMVFTIKYRGDWFCWENLNWKPMVLTIKFDGGFRLKFSHHPILWYDLWWFISWIIPISNGWFEDTPIEMETSIWALWGDTLQNSMENLAQTITLIPYFPGKDKFPQRWSSPPRKIASFKNGGLDGISHLKLRASGWKHHKPKTPRASPGNPSRVLSMAQDDWILNDKNKESAKMRKITSQQWQVVVQYGTLTSALPKGSFWILGNLIKTRPISWWFSLPRHHFSDFCHDLHDESQRQNPNIQMVEICLPNPSNYP